MSGIPSDIAGSALQAGFQARNVSRVRDADRTGQAQAAKNSAQAIDESGSTIETGDNDAQIYADAEGTGSKGRVFEEEVLEESAEDEQADQEGLSTTDDGQVHLDIEA